MAARKEYNNTAKDEKQTVTATLSGDELDDSDSDSDTDSVNNSKPPPLMRQKKRPGPKRKLDWKTEYLVYCFYAKCNISMRRTAALFGIKQILGQTFCARLWASRFFQFQLGVRCLQPIPLATLGSLAMYIHLCFWMPQRYLQKLHQ
jgi:hypothetical protein